MEHEAGLTAIPTTVERAHDKALLVCYSSNHLLGEFSHGREMLGQFLKLGVHGQLALKKSPDKEHVLTSLAIVQRNTVPLFLNFRTNEHEAVPFLLIDEPAKFGPGMFAPMPPDTGAWGRWSEHFSKSGGDGAAPNRRGGEPRRQHQDRECYRVRVDDGSGLLSALAQIPCCRAGAPPS